MPVVPERLFQLAKRQKIGSQQETAMEVSRGGWVPVGLSRVCLTLLPSNIVYKEGFCSAFTELNPVLAGGVVRTSWWSISSETSWGSLEELHILSCVAVHF